MIALIRKNLRLWGYGKSLALFTGCILFSISGRLNGGIAYERHILSAVSDHYYLTYFVLPIVLLIKHGGALGCEQRHILNDFLSVDSGQPLSGWFSLKSILPKRGSAFYINGMIFG